MVHGIGQPQVNIDISLCCVRVTLQDVLNNLAVYIIVLYHHREFDLIDPWNVEMLG